MKIIKLYQADWIRDGETYFQNEWPSLWYTSRPGVITRESSVVNKEYEVLSYKVAYIALGTDLEVNPNE